MQDFIDNDYWLLAIGRLLLAAHERIILLSFR